MKVEYAGTGVLFAYLWTAACLLMGTLNGGNIWFLIAIGFFTVWDIGWVTGGFGPRDRTAQEMLDSSTRARTYMSWFLSLYGAVLAVFLFQAAPEAQARFFQLCEDARITPILLIVPFVLTGLMLLFFPIVLGEGATGSLNQRTPTAANLSIMVVVAWTQKVATFSFLYAVMRLLYFTWHNHRPLPHG